MALIDNLMSYWKMDESAGDAIDAHGTNTLTDNNTVTAGTGKIGGARSFLLANSEYFSHADNAGFTNGGSSFAVAMWVNLNRTDAQWSIAGKMNNLSGEWEFKFDGGLVRFQFSVFGATGYGSQSTAVANAFGTPSPLTWYHVVFWYDAPGQQIGIAVNGGTANTTAHTAGIFATAAPFKLSVGDFSNYYDGLMDEVGYWKGRVLTSGERTSLYNGGAGLPYSSFGGATDTLPPVVASANVNAAGTTLTVVFTEAGSPPVLPASGVTGFTLTASGGAVTLSSTAISSLTYTATTSRTIATSETLTLAYVPGNVTDSAGTPNAMASFSGTTVSNNSTVTSPLVAGSITSTTVKVDLAASAASGGTGTITYQWYGSTTNGFTIGSGNLLAGQTAQNLVGYTVTTGSTYYFRRRATDSAGTPATADTVQYIVAAVAGGASAYSRGRIVNHG